MWRGESVLAVHPPGIPASYQSRPRIGGVHQPWPRRAAGRAGQANGRDRMARLGLHPHRVPHRRAQPLQHRRTVDGDHRAREPRRPVVHPGWVGPSGRALHVGVARTPGSPFDARRLEPRRAEQWIRLVHSTRCAPPRHLRPNGTRRKPLRDSPLHRGDDEATTRVFDDPGCG
jgi:hypothetical protein